MSSHDDIDVTEWIHSATSSFDAVYRANVRGVYSFAKARLGPTDAEDVVAEVFHAAVVAFRSGRDEMVTPAWLMAVTRNKVIDRWRKAERRMAKAHLLRPPTFATLPPQWNDDERREVVLATLDRLKQRHRALLILHHVEGLPIADIAQETGTSVAATDSALGRAREAFRREYAKVNNETVDV